MKEESLSSSSPPSLESDVDVGIPITSWITGPHLEITGDEGPLNQGHSSEGLWDVWFGSVASHGTKSAPQEGLKEFLITNVPHHPVNEREEWANVSGKLLQYHVKNSKSLDPLGHREVGLQWWNIGLIQYTDRISKVPILPRADVKTCWMLW